MKRTRAMGWMPGICLAAAGLCLATALAARGAAGALPPAPAGWGDCEVLDYVAEGCGGPVARGAADAGGTVERWLVRDAAAGTRYALERRPAGARDMSVCAYSPNRVLATLRPGSSHEAFAEELASRGMRIVRQLMEDLEGNPVYLIEAVDTEADVVDQMTMGIEETGACSMVKPDHIFSASVVPNDQNYGLQWGLEKIGAPQAWETRTDASSVPVAVLDTGINHDHFDLNMNLWLNEADPPGDGGDNDGNGIVDDTFGVSCLEGNLDGNAADDNGHGSHCAGIIGAEGNNRRLVAGVAWRAKVMALKFLNKSGRGTTSDAITCLRYAQEHGVRIVNCSFGSTDWDDYLYEQMVKMGRAGVVFVCAAGNAEPGMPPRNNDERPFYPANFHVDNLVSVAATDRDDNLANFSYYGKEAVDIAAPGVDIYSTVEGGSGSVGYKSGTSMAAPHVAGALALLMAEYPDETPDRIMDRLYAAAEPVEALEGKVRTGARLSLAGFFGIAPPADLSATQGTVQDAVVLYWQAAKEGTHYRVWRADSERGEKTMLCDWSRGLTFSDTGAAPGVTNWYFIQAARSADGDRASSFSAGVTGFRPPVDTTHVTVEFDPAGGTVSQERVRYLVGEPYGEFPSATLASMAFLGWFTAAEGGTRMGETSLAGAETTRLHAHWIDENIPRVANLFARQRYPWNGLVDVSLDLAGVPSGELASVALSGTGTDGGAAVPVRTFAAGSFASLPNGPHLAVWNAEADAPAGLCADLALSATVAVDVPEAPAAGTATDNPEAGAIDLEWSAARGASRYVVSRGTTDDRAAAVEAATVVGTAWRDDGAAAGTLMHYWVQSGSSAGTSGGALHLSARRGLAAPVVTATGGTNEKWIQLEWNAVDGATQYQVLRGTSDNVAAASTLVTLYAKSYRDEAVQFMSTYWYWVVAKAGSVSATSEAATAEITVDLMPLRSMLRGLDVIEIDGVISDDELVVAFNNPSIGNMDADPKTISADELDVLTRIQTLNQDKALISAVMAGTYSAYAGLTETKLSELVAISEKVRSLKNKASFVPTNVTASQENATATAQVAVEWARPDTVETVMGYEVWRAGTWPGTPEKVATVTTTNWADTNVEFRKPYWYRIKAVYESGTSGFSAQAKGYWGDWCLPDDWNLMPLMSLLTQMEAANPDGVLSDVELQRTLVNPGLANMDGDPNIISDDEMDVLLRIQVLNEDKDLISAVIRGDLTYEGMTEAQFTELKAISDKVYELHFSTTSSVSAPTGVTATQGNASGTAGVTVTWVYKISDGASAFEVYRSEKASGTGTKVASVGAMSYTDTDVTYRKPYWYRIKAVSKSGERSAFSAQAKGYWGDWCWPEGTIDLAPLIGLLSNIDAINNDGIISDSEMQRVLNNPSKADMDGDPQTISDEEMSILLGIQTLNTDRNLISAVMQGDLTYAGMTQAQLVELQNLSDAIKKLRGGY